MPAKYLFRLDDATAFLNKKKWKEIENIFDQFSIKPIVAITPDNQDETLKYSDFDQNFWDVVKNWQKKGWGIAMHGYQHLFHPVDRKQLILPFYNRSEFGGLPYKEQFKKIKKSLEIFHKNDIDPNIWVSPAHSFDEVTLEAIANSTNIRIISDGIALKPYYKNGFHFLPQQLWNIKRKYFGIWTVCLHPDTMDEEEISELKKNLSEDIINKNTVCLSDINLEKKDKQFIDFVYSSLFWVKYDLSRHLRPVRKILKEGVKIKSNS